MKSNTAIPVSILNEFGEYTLRTEPLEGVDHWVLPVIMMVEGVHTGSRGPLLYLAEELGRIPDSWNGIPVVINHPEEGSANSPDLVKTVTGRIFNTRMDGTRLRAEAWIDISRIESISPDAYEYIKENKALDVSVGVYSDEGPDAGTFNEEDYRATALNLRPDHLALLPHGVGACSWDDGCGIRTNKKKGEKMEDLKKLGLKELSNIGNGPRIAITENETGFREIMNNVQQKLDQLDNSLMVHYLEELFDGHFVYRVHNRESGGETKFFQRNYEVSQDGTVEFQGDPVEVRKEVSFQTLKAANKSIKPNKKSMDTKPAILEKVNSLIENEGTSFTEDNRKWLLTMDECQLNTLSPPEKKPAPVEVENSAITKENFEKSVNDQVTAIFAENKDPKAFIDKFFPDGPLKGQMLSGLGMYVKNREALVKGIVDNSKFKEENLKSWDDESLQNLYDSVVSETDYSIQNGAFLNEGKGNTKAIKAMIPGYKEEAKK